MIDNSKDKCLLTNVIETELDIVKRHVEILKTLQKNQPMGIIKLSELTNYPQHMVRYSLRILEQDGVIEPSSKGAVTTDELQNTFKSLKKSLNEISNKVNEIMKEIE